MVVHHLCADNTRRDRHDGVAHEHDYCAEHASGECCRCDVAVANGCHCHYGPIDTCGNIDERCAWNVPLDNKHEGSHADNHDDHKEEEDANFRGADDDGAHQEIALLQETEELEHAEDTDETEGAYNHKVAYWTEYPSDVKRKRAQEVNDAKETECIFFWLFGTIEATKVFQGEEECEDVLQNGEHHLSRWRYRLHAFDDDEHYACHDAPKQGNVKSFAKWRVTLEDDDTQLFA